MGRKPRPVDKELAKLKIIKDLMYEAIDGICSGACKHLTVGRLEDTLAIIKELEELLESRKIDL